MLHHPRHRPPRTWRRASRATSALLLVGATAWGVQLGVAAPNSSPVDPPTTAAAPDPGGGVAPPADAPRAVDDPVADDPVAVPVARDGRGGGRRGRP